MLCTEKSKDRNILYHLMSSKTVTNHNAKDTQQGVLFALVTALVALSIAPQGEAAAAQVRIRA